MNKDDDLFSFMVNTVKTLWYWHSTALMGLKQSASTGKPTAKYPYQRCVVFEIRLSHPERSNKNLAFLQNNPFVHFLSAKEKFIHSELWWAGTSFVKLKFCCQQQISLLCQFWIWRQCARRLLMEEMTPRATELAAAWRRTVWEDAWLPSTAFPHMGVAGWILTVLV